MFLVSLSLPLSILEIGSNRSQIWSSFDSFSLAILDLERPLPAGTEVLVAGLSVFREGVDDSIGVTISKGVDVDVDVELTAMVDDANGA